MHDLPTRMDTAVGAASAGYARVGRARDRRDRSLQRILHRPAARLRLPPEETAPVVLDAQGDPAHFSCGTPEKKKATAPGRGLRVAS